MEKEQCIEELDRLYELVNSTQNKAVKMSDSTVIVFIHGIEITYSIVKQDTNDEGSWEIEPIG